VSEKVGGCTEPFKEVVAEQGVYSFVFLCFNSLACFVAYWVGLVSMRPEHPAKEVCGEKGLCIRPNFFDMLVSQGVVHYIVPATLSCKEHNLKVLPLLFYVFPG